MDAVTRVSRNVRWWLRAGGRAVRSHGRRWAWALAAAAMVVDGLRLRRRAASLTVLAGATPVTDRAGGVDGAGSYVLVAVSGAHVDVGGLAVASRHATRRGLDLLELVPADLDPDRALGVARAAGRHARRRPARGARWAGGGAAQAVLVSRDLLARLGARAPDRPVVEADVAELVARAAALDPARCDRAVVAAVRSAPETPDRRRALLHVVHGRGAAAAVALPLAGHAGLAAGALMAPGWAALAAVAHAARPWLALRGSPLAGGLSPRALASRPAGRVARAVHVTLSGARPQGTLVGAPQATALRPAGTGTGAAISPPRRAQARPAAVAAASLIVSD